MKRIKVTALPSKKRIKEFAKNVHEHQQAGKNRSNLYKDETYEEILRTIKSKLPKKGDVIELANAQHNLVALDYFAGWNGNWKYGRSYSITINNNGEVGFGTIQDIGHRDYVIGYEKVN